MAFHGIDVLKSIRTLPNNGKPTEPDAFGKGISNACFFISLAQLLSLMDIPHPDGTSWTTVRLRELCHFAMPSEMTCTLNHKEKIQQLADILHISIYIYPVAFVNKNLIRTGPSNSFFVPGTVINDNAKSQYARSCSIAFFGAHFEAIVSETPTSRELVVAKKQYEPRVSHHSALQYDQKVDDEQFVQQLVHQLRQEDDDARIAQNLNKQMVQENMDAKMAQKLSEQFAQENLRKGDIMRAQQLADDAYARHLAKTYAKTAQQIIDDSVFAQQLANE